MLHYKNIPVLASEGAVREAEGVTVKIGEPQILAARDESPDEGTFLAPKLQKIGTATYLNWSFDWDVLDPAKPDKPNGRISYDGGLTWEKQKNLMPQGVKFQIAENEITTWFYNAFEVPENAGVYKVPTWRSNDNGCKWSDMYWTDIEYPGTKGLDIYNPPEGFKRHDHNYARGGVKQTPPSYLEPFYKDVSRLRPLLHNPINPCARGNDGTLYSLTYGHCLKDVSQIKDWENDYWDRLDWERYAVMMQVSHDNGRTWNFAGIPVHGADYESRISLRSGAPRGREDSFVVRPYGDPKPEFKGVVDFAPGDGFSEPSMIVFPDGEMLCALRTGGNKPIYCIRSYDGGKTWTNAEFISPRCINPICGVLPKLVLLKNGILALCTGRPNCTVHFSKDRGHTWFLSETLYTTGGPWNEIYSGSHTNNSMIAIDDNTLLYAHDATRPDLSAPNAWLRKAGHGLIILRRIEVNL